MNLTFNVNWMLAQKGYLGKLSEPQIAQIFGDAPRVCPRFTLTPGSSPGQALAFSHRGRGDAIRRPASPAFAPRPLTLREGDGRVCNPPLPVWAPFVLRTFPPRAGETGPNCRLVG